jgi:hypothetical protein
LMGERQLMIPSARRLMSSLRDIGYDAPGAVADLVDNSIDAEARNIDVTVSSAGQDSWIRVADDGFGMSAGRLEEAMRYGSSRAYGEEDLGAFGLGLKTASLSQCRRLTVATRTGTRSRIEIRSWDLDHVEDRDAWELQRLTPSQAPAHLIDPLKAAAGTVVLWEGLDRVLDYARPDGRAAMDRLESTREEIADHLAMVFHRFLEGELRRGRHRIAITMNDRWVEPWDPFARSERNSRRLRRQWLPLRVGEQTHRVGVQPYLLPTQIQFSTPEAHSRASGPKRWNRQQGLYIYRRDRLIQSGGWSRLRTTDEHTKLARIAVNIPPEADSAFRTSVSKMSVTLPADLRPGLRAIASGVAAEAQSAYRQRVRLLDGEKTPDDESGYRVGPVVDKSQDWKLGDHWSALVEILDGEFADDPDRLRRVLERIVVGGSAASSDTLREQPKTASASGGAS